MSIQRRQPATESKKIKERDSPVEPPEKNAVLVTPLFQSSETHIRLLTYSILRNRFMLFETIEVVIIRFRHSSNRKLIHLLITVLKSSVSHTEDTVNQHQSSGLCWKCRVLYTWSFKISVVALPNQVP